MTHEQILEQSRKGLKAIYKQAKEKLAKLETGIVAQVGKWYKDPSSDYLVHVTKILGNNNYVEVYGFGSNGSWFNKWDTVVHQLCVEATPQEVEKALIEEAKKRASAYTEYDYNPEENELCGINNGRLESVFCDGHWEQPVDKFAELKEAHRNGAVIQLKMGNRWFDCDPVWTPIFTYRIKPEEKPTIKPRLGRKQERVILDDNNFAHEICTFHEKYKHLAPLVVGFLKGKDPSCPQ